MVKGFSEK